MEQTRRDFTAKAAALVAAPSALAGNAHAESMIRPWTAAALQLRTPSAAFARAITSQDIHEIVRGQIALIDQHLDNLDASTPDLVLTGEYFLTGGGRAPGNIDVVPFPGPETELVQNLANKRKVFIAAHLYTRDARFPDRYMNTSFIVDRTGNIVLKAYRLHTNHSHSPHDFLDEFLDKDGLEGLFPVANTELGKLAAITAMELNYPEVARALVLRGAEVLLHVSFDGIVDRSVKRARAIENEAYVVSVNAAGNIGIHPSMNVGSCIVDWRGEVLADLPQGTEGRCFGPIDVHAVRMKRGDMDLEYKGRGPNYLARMRVELFREIYGNTSIFPPNRYGKDLEINQTMDMKWQAGLFADARRNMLRQGIQLLDG